MRNPVEADASELARPIELRGQRGRLDHWLEVALESMTFR